MQSQPDLKGKRGFVGRSVFIRQPTAWPRGECVTVRTRGTRAGIILKGKAKALQVMPKIFVPKPFHHFTLNGIFVTHEMVPGMREGVDLALRSAIGRFQPCQAQRG